MKNILKTTTLLLASLLVFSSCVKDDDFSIPNLKIPFFQEEFQDFTQVQHNTVLNLPGWTNFAQSGSTLWFERVFSGNGYAQFNSFGTSDVSSIAWLITPEIDVTGKNDVKLSFQSAQNFVSDDANRVEAYVSEDFDGTNVLTATWTLLNANVAKKTTPGYLFVPSGEVDLSSYTSSGTIHIAFKATGSGTNQNLDGLFQIDNVYVYSNN
jgi:hypothetical protein